MRIFRFVVLVIKGTYDILATYLLGWILLLALLAWGFQAIFLLALGPFGFETTEAFWAWAEGRVMEGTVLWRLVGFGLLHLAMIILLRRRLRGVQRRVEGGFDVLMRAYRGWADRHRRGGTVVSLLFSAVVTLLLVPFVIQPTLVPSGWGRHYWALRAANLADGSASEAFVESVIGLYRRFIVRPVVSPGVGAEEVFPPDREWMAEEEPPSQGPVVLGTTPTVGRRPVMDRWDPLIWRVVQGEENAFALVKAFILVESGGRQFAVSSTGCAGLTQFCPGTAKDRRFRPIFGRGQIYPCRCRGRCQVPGGVQRDLESGCLARIEAQGGSFPCDLTDARFDPGKSIRAGWVYIDRLQRSFGGNLSLTYIGYNSGPAVSHKLWRALGGAAEAGLEEIAPLLAGALEPHFGSSAEARARSLVRVHLPKLRGAYQRYLREAPRVSLAMGDKM